MQKIIVLLAMFLMMLFGLQTCAWLKQKNTTYEVIETWEISPDSVDMWYRRFNDSIPLLSMPSHKYFFTFEQTRVDTVSRWVFPFVQHKRGKLLYDLVCATKRDYYEGEGSYKIVATYK